MTNCPNSEPNRKDMKAFWKNTYRKLVATIPNVSPGVGIYIKDLDFSTLVLPRDAIKSLQNDYGINFIIRRKLGSDLFELCLHVGDALDTILFISSINQALSHATSYQIANIFTDNITSVIRKHINEYYAMKERDSMMTNKDLEEIQQIKKELEEQEIRLNDISKQIDELAREVAKIKKMTPQPKVRTCIVDDPYKHWNDAHFNGEYHGED